MMYEIGEEVIIIDIHHTIGRVNDIKDGKYIVTYTAGKYTHEFETDGTDLLKIGETDD